MAARLFSVFATLCLWDINPRVWLRAYLESCAANGGPAAADLTPLLPWRMAAEQRQAWSLDRVASDSS